MPSSWNRSKATALALTLVLHLLLAAWLLALRFDVPETPVPIRDLLWLPLPVEPPPAPPSEPLDLPSAAPSPTTVPLPLPQAPPEISLPPTAEDWERTAREVAGTIGQPSGRRRFGEMPKAPAGRPKEPLPPSIWKKPLPRVGTTVRTPEGETILWVSDNCYVSLGSVSLTMKDLHQGRQGIRTCQIGVGRKKPRDDLFDSIKRPPPPQEPGCGPDGVGLSCAR